MSRDESSKRREIEDTTAARLAEIVAAAERAAKRVIDEAEAEARERLAGAEAEADRIVTDRLAALAELAAEVEAQAEELKRGAESLQQALAEVRAELGGTEALGGSSAMRGGEAPAAERRRTSPSLTVVGREADEGDAPEDPEAPVAGLHNVARASQPRRDADELRPRDGGVAGNGTPGNGATPAGARLLATQMAVSGSSRAEIEARLRSGFAIEDTTPILDAILGPEN